MRYHIIVIVQLNKTCLDLCYIAILGECMTSWASLEYYSCVNVASTYVMHQFVTGNRIRYCIKAASIQVCIRM